MLNEMLTELKTAMIQVTSAEIKIHNFLKNKDVRIIRGKYKERTGQIQGAFLDRDKVNLHILIYRIDNKVGFKGREKFIDDHYHEYYRLDQIEVLP